MCGELISDSPNGFDGISSGAKFFTQTADIDVDYVGHGILVDAPDSDQYALARIDPIRIGEKQLENVVFLCGQLDALIR